MSGPKSERPSGGSLAAPARFMIGHPDILGLLGCNVLLGMAFSFVIPFMSLFGEHEVGMSPTGFGLFMTLTSASGILASTILARWSDTRLSRRAVLLLGSAAGALGYVGYAFVRDPVSLAVIGSVLIGISTITFSQLFAHARELLARSDADPKDVPLYMNVFRLFFALAWTIGPAVASLVMAKYSYVGTYLVAASCFAALFGAVLRLVPARPPTKDANRQVPLRQTIRALARGEVSAHFVGFVLVFACGSLGSISLPLLIVETLRGTTRNVGIVYSVSPFFELPLMLLFGVLASRDAARGGHARLIRIGVLLAVGYYALLSLVRTPWQVYPLQVISAAITAVIQGVAITFFQDFLPDQVGTATNLYSNASRLGQIAGYLLFAQLAATLGYRGIFILCSAISGAALLIMWLFRPRTRERLG
jgi:MFS transporter, SET family, sugar efflux transporter